MNSTPQRPGPAARVYLLGTVTPAQLEALQRRLVYEISGDPGTGALIVCQVARAVTVGREGSAAHVRLTPRELQSRGWHPEWVARGGGVHVFAPGQVTCLPLFALESVGQTPGGYVRLVTEAVADAVRSFGLAPELDAERPGVRVRGRPLTMTGLAFRRGVATGGVTLQVSPDLALFRDFDLDADPTTPTSLQRECVGPVRVAAARQRLVEAFCARLGVARYSVLHHPAPPPPARTPPHASEPARP